MTLSRAQEPRRVAVAGGIMPVWTLGDGSPVLLLHGISANHTEWAGVAARLATEHRVVLPDLLGRGASVARPDASFGLDAEADRVARVLDELGVSRPLVAGHSHGASVALALADRVDVAGLLFVNPVTPWTRRPAILGALKHPIVRAAVAPLLRTCRRPLTRYILTRRVYGERTPDLADAVARYADPFADPARSAALLRIFRDWKPAQLELIAASRVGSPAPVRVVTGGSDRRISPADAARWAALLDAPCEVVAGAGHGLTEEHPDRIATVLRDMEAASRRGNHNRGAYEYQE